jgi:protein SCO1
MTRRDLGALGALGFLLVVTAGWWAAALWPLPAATPDWVIRARTACFGSTESGLPNSGGWIMLVGTPLTMLAALLVVWGGAIRAAVGTLLRAPAGRAMAGIVTLLVLAGSFAAYARIGAAVAAATPPSVSDAVPPPPLPAAPLASDAPPLTLVDQHGERFDLARTAGRVTILTFAFGHCDTICPLIVRNAIAALDELGELAPALVVVTLDPWRDTPARLPHVARGWGMPEGSWLLGGAVAEVEATLDGWAVTRARDQLTGDVAHPSLAYVLDPAGRIAYVVNGERAAMVAAARAAAGEGNG